MLARTTNRAGGRGWPSSPQPSRSRGQRPWSCGVGGQSIIVRSIHDDAATDPSSADQGRRQPRMHLPGFASGSQLKVASCW